MIIVIAKGVFLTRHFKFHNIADTVHLSLGGVGDWIGVACNVLGFMDHYVTTIFVYNGLGLWMVHVRTVDFHFAQFGLV